MQKRGDDDYEENDDRQARESHCEIKELRKSAETLLQEITGLLRQLTNGEVWPFKTHQTNDSTASHMLARTNTDAQTTTPPGDRVLNDAFKEAFLS